MSENSVPQKISRAKMNFIGQTFGRWRVIGEVEQHRTRTGQRLRRMLCQCQCGKIKTVLLLALKSGGSTSCGCFQAEVVRATIKRREVDLVGRRFGMLLVLHEMPHALGRPRNWMCRCDCGKTKVVGQGYFARQPLASCGCWSRQRTTDAHKKHGLARSRIYNIWVNMKRRCSDKDNPAYHNYGGRGITVCARWQESFENFYEDMGPTYKDNLTIDRVNNQLGYSKENCEWRTYREQANNCRDNHLLTWNGQTRTIAQWSRITGISDRVIWKRIRRKWPVEYALTAPLGTVYSTNHPIKRPGHQ